MDDLNIPNTERDLSVPTLNLARTFKVTLPGPDNTTYRNELQHVIDSLHPDIITCYTDGSGTDQGRGVGLIITTDNNNTRPVKSLSEPPRGAGWVVLTGGVLILSTEDKA